MTRQKPILALALMLGASAAYADDLNLGAHFNNIKIYDSNTSQEDTIGGGSLTDSTLNGSGLAWVYCVDLLHYVFVPGDYPVTIVTNNAFVNGAFVNNADQVAWLLDHFADAAVGDDDSQSALQAAIWHVIYPNLSLSNFAPATQIVKYNADLIGLGSDPVSNLSWFSPRRIGDDTIYQGLVGPSVPEPASILLLGTVLLFVVRLLKQKLAIGG